MYKQIYFYNNWQVPGVIQVSGDTDPGQGSKSTPSSQIMQCLTVFLFLKSHTISISWILKNVSYLLHFFSPFCGFFLLHADEWLEN